MLECREFLENNSVRGTVVFCVQMKSCKSALMDVICC